MKIQLNTNSNVTGSEELRASLTSLISDELSRFDDHITRLEVHLQMRMAIRTGKTTNDA